MSMTENLSFDDRTEIMGKSFESHVLILNFSDAHIITLNYVLETPIEISTLEFHPENPNVLIGGCISGQLIIWDLSCVESRITSGKKPEQIKMPDEEEDKTQQSVVKLKQLSLSSIVMSHRNYVSDIQFIPGGVKVDRKNPPPDGKMMHFISVSEDGLVNIWDTRPVEKENLRTHPDFIWKPFMQINLFR
jgi:dynein intermediate chain 3, axonemal